MAKRKHKTQRPPLSAQDIRFARLLFDRGATKKGVVECYLEAGFPPQGTAEATKSAAYRRAKNRHFRQFYRDLQDRAADSAQVDANVVTQALKRIALFDIRQVFDERGRILLPHQYSAAVAAGILGVESEELFENQTEYDPETKKTVRRKVLVGYSRKVKRVAPTEALKLLAQILRLVGQDADAGKAAPAPLVVGGEADPGAL